MKRTPFVPLLVLAISLLGREQANAATYYSVASGNWNATGTWSTTDQGTPGAGPPVAGDTVFITRDWIVTNTANAACAVLDLGKQTGASAHLGTLVFAANSTLAVSGNVLLGGANSGGGSTGIIVTANGSTLTAGSLSLGNTAGGGSAGEIIMTNGGTLSLSGTITVAAETNRWSPGTGMVILSASGALPATYITNFNNLILSNNSTVTLSAGMTVTNLAILSGSTLDVAAGNYGIVSRGNWTNNGAFTARAGAVTFNGGVNQVIDGTAATTFNGVTMNNPNGATMGVNATVTNLTLTSGVIATGPNSLMISNASDAAITGGSATSYVNGNLLKYFNTTASQTFTFPVGDATSTNFVTLSSLSPTVSGAITVSAIAGNHPQLASSGISSTSDETEYWTLTQSSGAFGSFAVKFTYPSSEAGGTPANYVVRQYNGGAWTATTLSGTPTGAAASISGQSTFGAFAIGDQAVSSMTFGQQPTTTVAGVSITPAVTVTNFDLLGYAVGGASDTITLSSGTGTLSGTTTQSANASGMAAFNNLSINLAGTKQLTATNGSASVLSATFSITPAAASKLGMVTEPSSTATAGAAFATQPAVAVEDTFGNVITTNNTVTAALATGTGPLLGTTNVAAIAGVATFGNLTDDREESITLKFSAAGLTGVTDATTIVVGPANATAVRVETAADGSGTVVPAQNITSGNSITVYPITRDTFGNFVTNIPADSWSLINATGGVAGGDLAPSGDGKSAVFTAHLKGTASIQAVSGSLNSTNSGLVTVLAGAPSKLAIITSQQSLTAGVSSAVITVQVQDAGGNPTNATLRTVNLSSSSTGATFYNTNGTTVFTSTNIAASQTTASFLYKDTVAGTPTITSGAAGLTSGTQVELVSPAAASKLVITTAPVTLTAGVTSGTITAQSQDQYGNAQTNAAVVTVNLSSSSAGATFYNTNNAAISSTNILANLNSVSFFYRDTVTGAPTITNSAGGLTLATQAETVIPAGVSKLVITTAPVSLTAGVTSGTITVQSQDAFGNAQTNSTVVTVNLSSSSSGATFYNTNGATVISSTNILANRTTASFLYKDTMAGTPTITNSAGGLTVATQTEVVHPAAASKLAVATEPPASATAGVAFSPQPAIYVEDQYGNVVTNDNSTVTAALSAGTGPLQGTLTATASAGVAAFSNLADNKEESIKLKYTDVGLTAVTNATTIVVAAASATAVRVETAADGSGAVVSAQNITAGNSITVYAITRDMFGNFVTNIPADSWSLATKTGGVANGDLAPSGDSKSAVFTAHLTGTATIHAPSGSLTTTDSGLLTVLAGAPSKLAIITAQQSLTAGVNSGTITAQIQDAGGNPTNATVARAITLGTSSANGLLRNPADTASLTNLIIPIGQNSTNFLYRDTLAGTPTITASGTNITSGTQVEIVHPAGPSKLVMKTEPSSTALAGIAFGTQPAVYVEDLYGNVVTNDSSPVTATLATGTGPLQGTAAIAATAGVAAFASLADNTAESITLKFSDGILTGVTDGTTITVNPAAIASYAVSAPSPQTAGVPFTTTVTAKDSFGNVVTTNSTTVVTMSAGSGNVTFTGNPMTLSSGTFSITTLDSAEETVTLTATDSLSRTGTTNVVVQQVPWYTNSSWAYREKIIIWHTNVFQTDQTNFPVLVSLTNASLAAHALASGNDILFTAGDGISKLSYEREQYVSGSGTLAAWVRIPILSHTVDTVLYMYYGAAGATDQQKGTNVWDSNFKGVWHLKETTGPTSADSTTNGNNGTWVNSPAPATGKIDGGLGFNGANSQVSLSTTFSLGTTNVTFGCWANLSSTNLRGAFIKIGGTNALPGSGYAVGVGSAGAGGNYDTNGNQLICLYETQRWIQTGTNFGTNWHHVVVVLNASGYPTVYLDGAQVYTDTNGVPLAPNTISYFGGYYGSVGPRYFNGALDEIRISSAIRSAGWIQTEYTNQASPANFLSVGPEFTESTSTSVSSSANPSTYGQSVTFTANVTGSGGTPAGTVQFKTNGANFGAPVTLAGGSATSAAVSAWIAGTYTVTAAYSGDSYFNSSAGTLTGGQVVDPATLTVTPNAVSVVYSGVALSNTNYSTNTANYSITGFQNGETVASAVVTLSGSMAFNGSTSTPVKNIATYSQAVGSLTLSSANNNYQMTFSNPAPNNYVILAAGTTAAVATSLNPALPTNNVTFTATVTAAAPSSATPTGTVLFTSNGKGLGSPAALINGQAVISLVASNIGHGSIVIAALYTNLDGNFTNSSASLSPNQIVDTPPVGLTHIISANMNTPLIFAAGKLANNDSDADGDPLSVIAVVTTSTNGGSVTLSSGMITYNPVSFYVGPDQFTYTISDSCETGTGTVNVNVHPKLSENIYIVPLPDNNYELIATGIPGDAYTFQATSTANVPSSWLPISTNVAAANGLLFYFDYTATNYAQRYYRLSTP